MTAAAYSRIDRLLHAMAFSSIGLQKAIADIEDRLYAQDIAQIPIKAPVFITSLPRAGTTLFLEVLSALPGFGSHTYRHMPFLLFPLLWARISAGLRKAGDLRERAHGDGVLVGYDSPEAFEEVVWKAFWPKKYEPDRIIPWSAADRDGEFEAFLRHHMQKILALGGAEGEADTQPRYVSKNNANIARLALLDALFPDCRIVMPVRRPWEHVASLRRQHARFLELHERDSFARRYMAWLGHYEFGANLKPFDFGGWIGDVLDLDPGEEAFWLTYWAESYEAVLAANVRNLVIVDYTQSCAEPVTRLEALADALDLEDAAPLLAQARHFRAPTRYDEPSKRNDPLARRVEELYAALLERAI